MDPNKTICQVCHNGIIKHLLKEHLNLVHSGEFYNPSLMKWDRAQCERCWIWFSTKGTRTRHQKTDKCPGHPGPVFGNTNQNQAGGMGMGMGQNARQATPPQPYQTPYQPPYQPTQRPASLAEQQKGHRFPSPSGHGDGIGTKPTYPLPPGPVTVYRQTTQPKKGTPFSRGASAEDDRNWAKRANQEKRKADEKEKKEADKKKKRDAEKMKKAWENADKNNRK